MFPKFDAAPLIYEELAYRDYTKKNEENIIDNEFDNMNSDYEMNQYKGIHLIILCHGFQGNSYDMKLLKNYLNYLHPESMFLCSSINEENTDGDI